MDRDDRSGPDPTADRFESIVAAWRREGAVPAWPGDDRPPTEPPRTPPFAAFPVPAPAPPSAPPSGPPSAPPSGPPSEPLPPRDEPDPAFDHFVPPEPPPLPRIGPPAVVGAVLLTLGLMLVTVPGLLGVPDMYGLPLGLLALASGIGWLVLRLWPAPPDDYDGDDDGAQI